MLGRVALVRLGGTLWQQPGIDHLIEPSNASNYAGEGEYLCHFTVDYWDSMGMILVDGKQAEFIIFWPEI